MQIDEILEAFKYLDGTYKREHVDAAIQYKEKIIPYLIQILSDLRANPTPYVEDEDRFEHIYALMLLGHFRVEDAHNVIVDVFSMSEEIVSAVFEDMITEDLPGILLRICGGSLTRIHELLLSRSAYDFCRWAAATALVYAVIDGMANREAVLEFFSTLFTGQEAEADSAFWDGLASSIYHLYPEELMGAIDSKTTGLYWEPLWLKGL